MPLYLKCYAAAGEGLYLSFQSGTLNISSPDGFGNAGGVLDLADNDMIVHDGNLNNIGGWLGKGYDGGAWDGENASGTAGPSIISSVAAAAPLHTDAIGYAEIGTSPGELNISSLRGQSVSTGNVVAIFTNAGYCSIVQQDATITGRADQLRASCDGYEREPLKLVYQF